MNTFSDYFQIEYFRPEISYSSIRNDRDGWKRTYPHKPFVTLLKYTERLLTCTSPTNWHPIWGHFAYGYSGDIQVRIDAAPDAIVSEGEQNVGPVSNGRNQALKDGRPIKRPIKDGELDAIKESPGLSRPQLMTIPGKGRMVVTEAFSFLLKEGLIEHRGSRKTSGYYAMENHDV